MNSRMIIARRMSTGHAGFTLIELVVVIIILGVLGAVAMPKFVSLQSDARTAAIKQLAASLQVSMSNVNTLIGLHGPGTAGTQTNITWVALDANTSMRVWSGYPDRWCDGIGLAMQGATVPAGGCYLSSNPVSYGQFTFYGFGNSKIPNAYAGWRLESATNPQLCSVGYNYAGTTAPALVVNTSGC